MVDRCKKQHQGENDSPQCEYSCELCRKYYNERSRWMTHMRTHSLKNPELCEFCGKVFRTRSYIKRHMQLVHDEKRIFECEYCGQFFNFKRDREKHMLTHLSQLRDKSISDGHALKVHMKTHGSEKLFSCEICGRGFKNKQILANHKVTHSDEKPFGCEHCSKCFKRRDLLKEHVMRMHTNEKFFSCTLCSKISTNKRDLSELLKYHKEHMHESEVKNTGLIVSQRDAPDQWSTTEPDKLDEYVFFGTRKDQELLDGPIEDIVRKYLGEVAYDVNPSLIRTATEVSGDYSCDRLSEIQNEVDYGIEQAERSDSEVQGANNEIQDQEISRVISLGESHNEENCLVEDIGGLFEDVEWLCNEYENTGMWKN